MTFVRGLSPVASPWALSAIRPHAAAAAEDTAFVFFPVWGLPAGSRLCVSSTSFGDKYKWERAVLVE